ncbi:MAG: hypothetical protein JSR85_05830 [Proteobacteria bacterium]|nr:hypothetical protein [Pseudomonadota bacterium]
MKAFEIVLLSAAVFFSIAQKADATTPPCPSTEDVQNILKCPSNKCSADIDGWSGSASGVDGQLTLRGAPNPMSLRLSARGDTPGCAYNTNQDGVILYLELKK